MQSLSIVVEKKSLASFQKCIFKILPTVDKCIKIEVTGNHNQYIRREWRGNAKYDASRCRFLSQPSTCPKAAELLPQLFSPSEQPLPH